MAKNKKPKLYTVSNYYTVTLPSYIYFSSFDDADLFCKTYLQCRNLSFMRFENKNIKGKITSIEFAYSPYSGTPALYFRITKGYIDNEGE